MVRSGFAKGSEMHVYVGVLSWGPPRQALLEVLSFGESVVLQGNPDHGGGSDRMKVLARNTNVCYGAGQARIHRWGWGIGTAW